MDIEKLPKWRKDWLEVFGNQWKAKKVAPGTCEACIWGEERYPHSPECVTRLRQSSPTLNPGDIVTVGESAQHYKVVAIGDALELEPIAA